MEKYKDFSKHSAVNEIEAIPQNKERQRIIRRIGRLAGDPRPPGSHKLSGNDKYRVRQGSCRIVFSVEDNEDIVVVMKPGHRNDVYRGTFYPITQADAGKCCVASRLFQRQRGLVQTLCYSNRLNINRGGLIR